MVRCLLPALLLPNHLEGRLHGGEQGEQVRGKVRMLKMTQNIFSLNVYPTAATWCRSIKLPPMVPTSLTPRLPTSSMWWASCWQYLQAGMQPILLKVKMSFAQMDRLAVGGRSVKINLPVFLRSSLCSSPQSRNDIRNREGSSKNDRAR